MANQNNEQASCPWGAPISASPQWGSPMLPSLLDSQRGNSTDTKLPCCPSSPMRNQGNQNNPYNNPNNSTPRFSGRPSSYNNNSFSNNQQQNSPRGQFQHNNNRGGGQAHYSPQGMQPRQRFQQSPRTPNHRQHNNSNNQSLNQSFNSSQQSFHTPPSSFSPRPRFNSSRGGSAKRGNYGNSFGNNSGNSGSGSINTDQYYHPSMLEDPWKDIPATPMMKTY